MVTNIKCLLGETSRLSNDVMINNSIAENDQKEIDNKTIIASERDFGLKEIVHFDDELLLLAREYEKLRKEYLKEKAKIEKLNNKIEILEKNNAKKS